MLLFHFYHNVKPFGMQGDFPAKHSFFVFSLRLVGDFSCPADRARSCDTGGKCGKPRYGVSVPGSPQSLSGQSATYRLYSSSFFFL